MRTYKAIPVAAFVALFSLAGCDYLPFVYTPIKEIVAEPGSFEGKEVKIKGKVVDVIKLPILGQAYVVRDDGADITVMTNDTLPPLNSDVALKGIVRSTAIVGGQSIGLRVEETKRLR